MVSFFTRSPISRAAAVAGGISPRISCRIKCSISSWKISRCSMQRTSASVVVMVMMNSGLVIQEILQQGVAVFAQYGFRVELDAVHGQCLVAQAHDLA